MIFAANEAHHKGCAGKAAYKASVGHGRGWGKSLEGCSGDRSGESKFLCATLKISLFCFWGQDETYQVKKITGNAEVQPGERC